MVSKHRIILLFQFIIIVFLIYHGRIENKDNKLNMQLLLSGFEDIQDNEHQSNTLNQGQKQQREMIHVGVVSNGYSSYLNFYYMLKSIYFHLNNPIHFHIIVNKFSKMVLETLFNSWDVTQVNVTFYNISEYLSDVIWVRNNHYSGTYGLIKLLFPKMIPLTVTNRIIILDTDLTFLSDIYKLWQEFENFLNSQAIGLVDNQSDFYLGNWSSHLWPAIGKGFNSGIILYHLERLKEIDWDKIWVKITKQYISKYGPTNLADQDIINSVIKQYPDVVYRISCEWNIQLSDHTQSRDCYKNFQIQVLHWNSPKKLNVVNPDIEYFKSLYQIFVDLNGDLLKKQLFYSKNNYTKIFESSIDKCYVFYRASAEKWRTLLFFRKFEYVPTKNDVTISIQLSYDRIQMAEELCRYWDGPASLTFYVTDSELQKTINFIKNSEILQSRLDIAYHAVFKHGDYYPMNVLRNIGLKHIITPYVFLVDVDFLPMKDLYNTLKYYIGTFKNIDKKALVVPAFEAQQCCSSLPQNKTELLQRLDDKSVLTFQHDASTVKHSPVNYIKWKTAKIPYIIKWKPDFEPYIVVQANVTEYDKRFLGFDWNKISHIMELEAQGYDFTVLPNTFIIHKPHASSTDISQFERSSTYRMCLQNLKRNFIQYLNKTFGRVFSTKNI